MKKLYLLLACALALLLAPAALAEADANEGFRLAAETQGLALYVNETTLETRVADKIGGQTYSTKIMDGKNGNKTVKNNEKSDFRVYYMVNSFVGTTNSMDSNSMSREYGNYALTYIENGFEIRYEIGDMTLVVDDLPKMIPVEKYNTLLLPHWTSKQDDAFREYYRVYQQTMWVRTDDGNIGKVKLKNLYELLYSVGEYTLADRDADNAAYGYEIETVNPRVTLTIRFQLDGNDLLVSVPCADIEYTPGNMLTRIDVLPYFLTATQQDQGYIFVPDGSGSLIRLNNGKTMALSYTDSVYGKDILKNADDYSPAADTINFPVYGIKTQNGATLAIIEQGAEIASLFADISGRSDEFNRIYSYFTLREIELISVVSNASDTTPRYPEDVYTGDIVLRYKFLSGGDADCVGMANAYREYLVSRGMLTARETAGEAPLFIELIGAVRKTRFFAGVPYASTAVATTLSQAAQVFSALTDAGVDRVILMPKGIFEGGVWHESLDGAALEDSVGTQKQLNALAKLVKDAGGELLPAASLLKVYTGDDFRESTQAARRQDNFIASVVELSEPILAERYRDTDSFYVSPRYLAKYAQKAVKGLQKLALGGLRADDLPGTIVADYRKGEHQSRIHARAAHEQALESLKSAFTLALDDPNDYALRYADYVTGLSATDNGHKVEDAAIPFAQWVLDGYCEYTTKPWNESAYNGVQTQLLYAIESKSAPYFRLTYADETVFLNSEADRTSGYFRTQYADWLTDIARYYRDYRAFYAQVKDARVVKYEFPTEQARKITYDNGVCVYVNYAKTDAAIDGRTVPAMDALIVKGGVECAW